ncbi:MAG: hypothetical protein E7470_02325 [Ruminococcaceae bacterium]|nr:hypothetical protein [Oscillospiraceae bacterium]
MKKLLSIMLVVAMIMAFAVPAMANGETESTEPELYADAYDMTYYVAGYGAMPNRYQCTIKYPGEGYGEWFDISYGDPIVENWPTEAGTYTVTFDKITTIEGAGDEEYTFNVSMNIIVQELPATSGKCGDNMTWSFDTTTDTLTISGNGDMYTVAESDEDFQRENFNYEPGWWHLPVKHIVIEEGVENLANYAFTQSGINKYYEILETIQLPATLKAIPELGFLLADDMTSLTIPEGITSLTGWPFGYPGNSFLSLTELYLPSTLTEMDILTICLGGIDRVGNFPTLSLKKIHFAGTEEQWQSIQQVKSDEIEEIFGEGTAEWYSMFAEPFAQVEIIFEPKEEVKEEIIVENGTATVPDSSVEITEGEDVVIDVTDTKENISSVVIGSEIVEKITDAENAIEIKLPDATVSFDKTAIGSIGTQAGETAVTIVAKEVEDTTLTTEQKAALEEKEVCTILNLEAFAGESKITEFGGGKVTVSVPFELPEGKAGTDYYVAYVADDGTITAMPTTYADGILSFETTHFSNYVVLENKTVTPPLDPDIPETGDNSLLVLFVVLMVASAAGLTVCFTKRRAI